MSVDSQQARAPAERAPVASAAGATDGAARPRSWRPSTRTRVISDVTLFVLFLSLSAPTLTGLPVHEWLVVPLIPVFLGHLITSWTWITTMARRGARSKGRPRINRVLDVALFVLVVTAIYSGFAISVELLPFLGLEVVPRSFWVSAHAASANLLVVLVAVHLYLHWKWVRRNVLRRKAAEKVTS